MSEHLCACGCGQRTTRIRKSVPSRGEVAGEYRKYVRFHHNHRPSRDRYLHPQGYWYTRVAPGKRRREHLLVAERALGRRLPENAVVHHVNGDPADNRPQNLVICEDRAYHALLHQRQRAYEACGHADWPLCRHCGKHDDPTNLFVFTRGRNAGRAYHRACHAAANRRKEA